MTDPQMKEGVNQQRKGKHGTNNHPRNHGDSIACRPIRGKQGRNMRNCEHVSYRRYIGGWLKIWYGRFGEVVKISGWRKTKAEAVREKL